MQLFKSLLSSMVIILLAAGCSKQSNAPMQFPPPEVGVITVSSKVLPITTEFPGRIDAERVAQVRARATGVLLKRLFVEGSEVKEGDALFQIDPAPLQAALDSTKAGLAKAQAELTQMQAKADRYKELVAINAVSKQDYDDALGTALQAKADVATAQAAVETATLNLGYANVTAPIRGKIGEALVTEGAYVTETQANELAVIQQLDPIYFDFTESSTDLLKLRNSFDKGQWQKVAPDEAKVTLVLEDGSTYPVSGKLLFSDITVDPSTGMITLRSEFPNPDHVLLPGMFARAKLAQAIDQHAITVLQRAVSLNGDGSASVMMITTDNKVEARTIKLGDAIADAWVVTDGLKAGDTVIVEGLQKIKPGMPVKPVPFNADNTTDAAAQGK